MSATINIFKKIKEVTLGGNVPTILVMDNGGEANVSSTWLNIDGEVYEVDLPTLARILFCGSSRPVRIAFVISKTFQALDLAAPISLYTLPR